MNIYVGNEETPGNQVKIETSMKLHKTTVIPTLHHRRELWDVNKRTKLSSNSRDEVPKGIERI